MKAKDKKILIFLADQYEDLELQYPKYRMLEAGYHVVVAGEKKGETYKGLHGVPCVADASFDKLDARDFDALIIPGGYAPDKLRKIHRVIEITRHFHEENKLIAFICHAGWVPVSAKILEGVTCTSVGNIKDDVINAGAHWVDAAVVTDGHFISSRSPLDLPFFCPAIIEYLENETDEKHGSKNRALEHQRL